MMRPASHNFARTERLCLAALLLVALVVRAETTRPLSPQPLDAGVTLTPAADPNHFTFAVCGDNRPPARHMAAPPTAVQVFAELRLLQPALCLWTGDVIYGSDDSVGEARAEYDAFFATAAQSETPLFNAPGNHEIADRKELEALYESCVGPLYGSFDYGHSHFIALDTEEVGQKPGVGKAQRDWLERDLAANRPAAHIFVFTHHPLFSKKENAGFADGANRDDIHRLFVRYGVKHVFSGHEHLFAQSVHDGINYIVTGGGGAPSSDSPVDGGFQHYLLLDVNGDKVSFSVFEPWRLFSELSPVQPDGSCTALVSNYRHELVSVAVQFPTDALGANAVANASWTYKGATHPFESPLEAKIVPSRKPGFTTVRVTVPASRAVMVTLAPEKKDATK